MPRTFPPRGLPNKVTLRAQRPNRISEGPKAHQRYIPVRAEDSGGRAAIDGAVAVKGVVVAHTKVSFTYTFVPTMLLHRTGS